MIKYLLGRSSAGKFRFAVVECEKNGIQIVNQLVI